MASGITKSYPHTQKINHVILTRLLTHGSPSVGFGHAVPVRAGVIVGTKVIVGVIVGAIVSVG